MNLQLLLRDRAKLSTRIVLKRAIKQNKGDEIDGGVLPRAGCRLIAWPPRAITRESRQRRPLPPRQFRRKRQLALVKDVIVSRSLPNRAVPDAGIVS